MSSTRPSAASRRSSSGWMAPTVPPRPAETAEELKARLAVKLSEYARLRLAAVVLHESIERYRHQSQGPVLNRTASFFKQLTLGSFESLRIDYDDDDQAVLLAVRPGGTDAVGIAGLSLGTADQLYLALRLASLETYLEKNDPVPLIVDDVLIQFDDNRAAAALRPWPISLFEYRSSCSHIMNMCVNWRKSASSPTGSSCTISPGGRPWESAWSRRTENRDDRQRGGSPVRNAFDREPSQRRHGHDSQTRPGGEARWNAMAIPR